MTNDAVPTQFENERDLRDWIADRQHELELRAYEGADFDYNPFADLNDMYEVADDDRLP